MDILEFATKTPVEEMNLHQMCMAVGALRQREKELCTALQLSTNGLRHCSHWNISEETEKAIMTQVIANEALLTPNA